MAGVVGEGSRAVPVTSSVVGRVTSTPRAVADVVDVAGISGVEISVVYEGVTSGVTMAGVVEVVQEVLLDGDCSMTVPVTSSVVGRVTSTPRAVADVVDVAGISGVEISVVYEGVTSGVTMAGVVEVVQEVLLDADSSIAVPVTSAVVGSVTSTPRAVADVVEVANETIVKVSVIITSGVAEDVNDFALHFLMVVVVVVALITTAVSETVDPTKSEVVALMTTAVSVGVELITTAVSVGVALITTAVSVKVEEVTPVQVEVVEGKSSTKTEGVNTSPKAVALVVDVS
jgi:hypothetical protein